MSPLARQRARALLPTRRRQLEGGRGERVVPGLWRLRLPLSIPGVPHVNAWALAARDGLTLVDTGIHAPGAEQELERALGMVGLALGDVRLIVCTHAHPDHAGAAPALAERLGCEVWLHPDLAHANLDAQAVHAKRLALAREAGVPDALVHEWLAGRAEPATGFAGPLRSDRALEHGVVVASDLGDWEVHATPGHAPSHVCLHLPEARLLITGDHVLGRVSLYFDHGWTPDPIAEFLASLDHVDALDARLALSGHGKPFTEVAGHVAATRALVHQRLDAVRAALARGPASAWELIEPVYGAQAVEPASALWLLTKLLCYLTHLERRGEVHGAQAVWVRS